MQVLQIVLAVAACLSLGTAQQVLYGSCPDVPPMDSFDIEQYAGDWYEQFRLFEPESSLTKCTKKNFAYDSDAKTVDITTTAQIGPEEVPAVTYTVSMNDSTPAIFKVTVDDDDTASAILNALTPSIKFWVVDTDYTSYSVLYHCKNRMFNIYDEDVWIHSRDRAELDSATVDTLKEDLKAKGVNLGSMRQVVQTGCTEDSDSD